MRLGATLLWPLAVAAFTLFVFLALTNWPPFGMVFRSLGEISDDLAFLLAVPYLVKNGAQWGPDVVFTYGPLGYLASFPLYGTQVVFFLVFRAALSLTTAYLIVALIQTTRLKLADRLFALSFFALLAYLWFIGWYEAYWITTPFVLLVLHIREGFERSALLRAAMLLAAALLGTATLVKFSFTVIYFGLFALMTLLDLTRRRIPAEAIVFVGAMVASWLLAGQSLSNYPVWISTSMNLSEGYSAAMAKGFYTPYRWYVVLCVYLSAILLVLSAFSAFRQWTRALVLGLAAFGFGMVNIQHSFGGNQIEQSMVAMISSAAVVVLLGSHRTRVLGCVSIGLSIAVLLATNFSFRNFASGPTWFGGHARSAVAALTGQYPDTDALRERTFASIRTLSKLPADLKGTADAYIRKTGVIMAYPGLDYRPRSSFISLNAHTKRLADDNAAHLTSVNAPDYIVYDNKPEERVNNRYPATDDGPSLPLIWSRYALQGQYGDLFLFRKRDQDIAFERRNERRLTTRALENVKIDASGPIWAKIDIKPTLLGSLLAKLYKSPHVYLQIFADDGSEKYYQIVPELGRAGFVLSPMIRNSEDFAKQNGPAVRSMTIVVENRLEWLFQPEITVTLSDLTYGAGK